MTVPIKNHSAVQTDWPATISEPASKSSLELAVLHSSPKETVGVLRMPTELIYDRTPFRLMEPALQTAGPGTIPCQTSNARLEIVVINTKPRETLGALRMAAELAHGLAPVRLLAVQVVPYPLDLYAPPISTQFLESRFAKLVSDAAVNASVDIRLGRDTGDMVESGIGPHSVVVIGGRRRWWPTATMRLARRLERQGHQVVFANGKYSN